MNLLAALLADHAVAHEDGTFSVTRGGINELSSDGYPLLARLFLILRVQLQPDEVGELHQLHLRISHEAVREIVQFQTPMVVNPVDRSRPAFWNLIGQLNLVLPWPGEYVFEGRIDQQIQLPLMTLWAKHTGVHPAPIPPPVSG